MVAICFAFYTILKWKNILVFVCTFSNAGSLFVSRPKDKFVFIFANVSACTTAAFEVCDGPRPGTSVSLGYFRLMLLWKPDPSLNFKQKTIWNTERSCNIGRTRPVCECVLVEIHFLTTLKWFCPVLCFSLIMQNCETCCSCYWSNHVWSKTVLKSHWIDAWSQSCKFSLACGGRIQSFTTLSKYSIISQSPACKCILI